MARFVTFPGTAGSYASTDDVNLFDADSAHTFQTAGHWADDNEVPDAPVAASWPFSGFAAEATAAGTTMQVIMNADATTMAPVVAGQTYSMANRIEQTLRNGATPPSSTMQFRWFDAGGSFLSNTGSTAQTVPEVGGGPVQWSITGVAPVGAFFLGAQLALLGNTGDVFLISDAIVRDGTDSTFVRSTRIVGDVDIRVDMSIVNGTVPDQAVLSSRSGSNGFMFAVTNPARFRLRHGTGLTDRDAFSDSPGIVDGERFTGRAVFDISAGQWTAYFNGSQFWTSGALSTDPAKGGVGVTAGSQSGGSFAMAGDLYVAEVRDGIDGPIVAVFDPDDIVI